MSQLRLTDLDVLSAEEPRLGAISLKEAISGFTEQHSTLTFTACPQNIILNYVLKRILGARLWKNPACVPSELAYR